MEKYLREVGCDLLQLVAENEDWKYAGFKIAWNEKALDALKKYFNA